MKARGFFLAATWLPLGKRPSKWWVSRAVLGLAALLQTPLNLGVCRQKMGAAWGGDGHKMAATAYLQRHTENSCAMVAAAAEAMLWKNRHSQLNLQWPTKPLLGKIPTCSCPLSKNIRKRIGGDHVTHGHHTDDPWSRANAVRFYLLLFCDSYPVFITVCQVRCYTEFKHWRSWREKIQYKPKFTQFIQ